jgi:hypothetical protein
MICVFYLRYAYASSYECHIISGLPVAAKDEKSSVTRNCPDEFIENSAFYENFTNTGIPYMRPISKPPSDLLLESGYGWNPVTRLFQVNFLECGAFVDKPNHERPTGKYIHD